MSQTLNSLRTLLINDPAAQAQLWALPDPAAFAARAAEMARGHGLAFDAAQIAAALIPRGPQAPAMPVRAAGLSAHWLPARMSLSPQGGRLDWIHAGGEAPFAHADFDRLADHPLNRLLPVISDPGELAGLPGPERPIDGLIFHISHSGAAVAARMLAAAGNMLVLSNPQPVAAVLRAHGVLRIDPAVQRAWLRAILGAYRKAAGTRRLVIALDADSLLDHVWLRAACPGAAAVVMHNDPLEILASQGEFPDAPPAEDRARWLAALCVAGAEAVAQGAATLAANDLPDALLDPNAPVLGLAFDETDRARMRAAAGADGSRERTADGSLRSLADTVVGPAYRRMTGAGA